MNKKSAFFSKAIYNSDLRRYGFVFLIYFFITEIIIDYFYIGMMYKWEYSDEVRTYTNMVLRSDFFYPISQYYLFTLVPLAVIFSIALFMYLKNEKALTSMQAMPVSRKSLYFTKYLVFISILASTLFMNFVLMSSHLIYYGFSARDVLTKFAILFLMAFILGLAVFTFASFIGIMVNNFILQTALIMVFFGMPAIIYKSLKQLAVHLLIGYNGNVDLITWDMKLSPYYFLRDMLTNCSVYSSKDLIGIMYADETTWALSLVISLCFLVISLLAGYYLYKKKNFETCTDFISFKLAKNIISTIIALILALIFAIIIGELIYSSTEAKFGIYIGAAIGAVLGYIIMKMISEKSLNPLVFLPKSALFAVIVLACIVLVDIDILGYESRVPNPEETAYAYIYENDWRGLDLEEIEEFYSASVLQEAEFSSSNIAKLSGDDIAMLNDFHRNLIANTKDSETNIAYGTQIVYVLKNGKVLRRSYNELDDSSDIAKLRNSESNRAYLLHSGENYLEKYIQSAKANGEKGYFESLLSDAYILVDADKCAEFMRAYLLDRINCLLKDEEDINSTELMVFGFDNREKFILQSDFENSISWLKENSYGKIIENASTALKIDRIKIYSLEEGAKDTDLLFDIKDEIVISSFYKYFKEIKEMYLHKEDLGDSDDSKISVEICYSNGESKVYGLHKRAYEDIKSMLTEVILD